MKERLKGLIIGVLIGTALTCGGVFAEYGENINLNELLEPIYVSFNTVKHILIKDVEKMPPDDMKPFVYNGRTYVALRYVSEALGQNVTWDDKTGTVSIGGEVKSDVVKSYSNKLTDYDLLQKWDYFGSKWKVDGENGLYCLTDYIAMSPKVNFPKQSNDYEVELDFLPDSEGDISIFVRYSAFDVSGKSADFCSVKDEGYFKNLHLGVVNGDKTEPNDIKELTDRKQFNHLKLKVKNGICEAYINGTYINATKVKGTYFALSFYGSQAHFKNLKVTIND